VHGQGNTAPYQQGYQQNSSPPPTNFYGQSAQGNAPSYGQSPPTQYGAANGNNYPYSQPHVPGQSD
jgi:hypothetical protein